MSQVDLLYRLQQIDNEIEEKKKRLGRVLRLQAESEELAAARRRAEAAAIDLRKGQAQQQDLNLELKGVIDKSRRSEDRLYSGTVKNPKELADLQHEIDALARRRSALEDELLEAMILVEEAQEEDSEAQESLERIQTQWAHNQQNLRQEQGTLASRLNELAELRKQQLGAISPQFLSVYQNASRRLGGLVVVQLRNGRCTGCQVSVPANQAKAADEGQLVMCDNCGRILCPA
jgi:uncharacterized protein